MTIEEEKEIRSHGESLTNKEDHKGG